MTAHPASAAGVTPPDTKLAAEATALVRDSTTDLVFDHSRRVYWFGSLLGRDRGLSFDPELLYIGAMFHDLGLGERFRQSGRRFEVEGWSAERYSEVAQTFLTLAPISLTPGFGPVYDVSAGGELFQQFITS